MAFTKKERASGGDFPIKWDRDVHSVITGRLIEKKFDVKGKPGSNVLVLANKSGDLKYTVWSSKMLDDYFSTIELETVVRIEFLGKEKSKSSSNLFNNYIVDVGEESDLLDDVFETPKKGKKGEEESKMPF